MKEANIFEAWANSLMEGTWSLPDTPEKQDQLVELLSQDLPVGADATNATEQLYDLVGDDVLFDQLGELAERDANADARQVIIDRLQELSEWPEVRKVLDQLQIDATAEMNPPEATNPADLEPSDDEDYYALPDADGDRPQGLAESLNAIRRTAGLTENVLTDSTGSTFQHILDTFKRDVRDFKETGEVSDALHNALYDYYFDDMPYGTKKARDGDPYEWVADRFGADLGIDGYGGNSPGIPDSDYSMERESVGDYADEYQDSLSGILKIAGVPAQERPAPDYETGDMEEGIVGAALGGIGGALVGGPVGALRGASIGDTVGDAIGSDDQTTDEAIDPTNPRDYEIPTVQRQAQGQAPLTPQDVEQKDRKAEFDFYQRARGKPHPDSVADESKSPLAGQYGHSGKMKEVSKDVSFLDRLKELSGMKK